MRNPRDLSQFVNYLVSLDAGESDTIRLPTLIEISQQLGVSVSKLREQLEVARTLGFVEVRPRTGIRRIPFAFSPAVRQSLNYAVALDRSNFEQFSDLRNHVESAYWFRAVELLTTEDHERLVELVERAWQKLRGTPIRIPHREHRELHMAIYSKLENPFVVGIFEAFWEAYEAVGLNLYADYAYLEDVWGYHQQMVDGIVSGDPEAGFQALVAHTDLLHHRPASLSEAGDRQTFVVANTTH